MRKGLLAFAVCVLFCPVLSGAQVLWSCVTMTRYDSGTGVEQDFDLKWGTSSTTYCILLPCSFSHEQGNGNWNVSLSSGVMECIGTFYVDSAGDVVNKTAADIANPVFFFNDQKFETHKDWAAISGSSPDVAYIAFELLDKNAANPVYGWMELTIYPNTTIELTGSAIDLDGGPMIVGGGAWEGGIPEPSGGILFLLGMAVLGLRRISGIRAENCKRRFHG